MCVAFIWAPETTAPWGSTTVPEIEPFRTWLVAGIQEARIKHAVTRTKKSRSLEFMLPLSIFVLEKVSQPPAKVFPLE
jgi:hypothetical protein